MARKEAGHTQEGRGEVQVTASPEGLPCGTRPHPLGPCLLLFSFLLECGLTLKIN